MIGLASFPDNVIQHSDKSSLRKKVLILLTVQGQSPSWQGIQGKASVHVASIVGNQMNACSCSTHFVVAAVFCSPFYTVQDPLLKLRPTHSFSCLSVNVIKLILQTCPQVISLVILDCQADS